MRYIRSLAPGALVLALTITLAACTQAASPTPSPEPIPTGKPAPSDAPSDEPSQSPTPSEPEVIVHELPMIGRVTDDGVAVLVAPTFVAQPLSGERFTDPGTPEIAEVVLDADDLVVVTMGPLLNDGESWYEVASIDGDELVFAFGWIPGRYLESDDEAELGFILVDINGQGEGASEGVDTIGGHPLSVRFAAAPMPDADSCELDVTLVRTDGTAVNVATETVIHVMVVEVTSQQLSSLFQEAAGTVTLEVETDCSFAATMSMPQS